MANLQAHQGKKSEPIQLDEKQLQEALDHLNELHAQLRALRTAIPNMISPLATKQSSPQALFSSFTTAVQESKNQVATFREAILNDRTKEIFKYAAESRRANSRGIKLWRPRDDPDWLERAKERSKEHAKD